MITTLEEKREEKRLESLNQINNDLNGLFADLAYVLQKINNVQENIKNFTSERMKNNE